MTVAIIDYGSGNLRSVAKALERAASAQRETISVAVTSSPDEVSSAERIVLPGVGAFADCMNGLTALDGMTEALRETIIGKGRPFLGICVGMQLMADTGHEHGKHEGLQWIGGDVTRLEPTDSNLKIPHMGWNEVALEQTGHPALSVFAQGPRDVYFVHSYRFDVADDAHLLASTDYGGKVAAIVGHGNLLGTQFHPEKSQDVGLQFLADFLTWSP